MSIQLSDSERAQIAHEVGQRYGVLCRPDVVQRLAPGHSGTPEYVWDGRSQLVPVVKREHSAPLRAAIDAKWKSLARQRRLQAAKDREEAQKAPKPKPNRAPKAPNTAAATARIKEIAAARAAEVRLFAAKGATVRDIAAKLNVTEHYARSYCAAWEIDLVPQDRKVDPDLAARRARVKELAAAGLRAREIAEQCGVNVRVIEYDLRRLGLRIRKPAAPPKPKHDRLAPVLARRARVAALVAEGVTSSSEIAARLDITRRCAQIDLVALRGAAVRPTKPSRPTRDDISAAKIERTRRIGEMRSAGMTGKAISLALNCSLHTVFHALSALGLTNPDHLTGHIGNPEMIERVMHLFAQGMARRRIADQVGISLGSVQRIIVASQTSREGVSHAA